MKREARSGHTYWSTNDAAVVLEIRDGEPHAELMIVDKYGVNVIHLDVDSKGHIRAEWLP